MEIKENLDYGKGDSKFFHQALKILKYPLVELDSQRKVYGFVNKNFFKYHPKNVNLTKNMM